MSRCGGKTGSSFLSRKFSPFCFLPPEFSLILPTRIHLSLWDAPKSLSLPPHTHTWKNNFPYKVNQYQQNDDRKTIVW